MPEMPKWTIEGALETAIVDGINIFVREVLAANGYLVPEKAGSIAMPPIVELKYQVARNLAQKWAKMTFVDVTLKQQGHGQQGDEQG